MNPTDAEIKQALKRWANRQTPPTEVRPRLIEASRHPRSRDRFERNSQFQLPEAPHHLLSWALVYTSIGRSVDALRLIS
jgi:hypothetical protein